MSKHKPKKIYDPNIIEALHQLPNPIFDIKHNIQLFIEGNARNHETRFEHIAKSYHELKVRDIQNIPFGINHYVRFKKNSLNQRKNTCYYYFSRKGNDKGFVCVAIRIDHKNSRKAYIKTIFITHRLK